MRIMGIDYGDSRTGVALSDITGSLVGETFVISEKSREKVLSRIVETVAEKKVTKIAVGYPKNMNGTLGSRAELCAAFAELVRERTGVETVLWDERLTTVDAHRILSDAGKSGKKRKQTVDAVASSLILEGYLTSLRRC